MYTCVCVTLLAHLGLAEEYATISKLPFRVESAAIGQLTVMWTADPKDVNAGTRFVSSLVQFLKTNRYKKEDLQRSAQMELVMAGVKEEKDFKFDDEKFKKYGDTLDSAWKKPAISEVTFGAPECNPDSPPPVTAPPRSTPLTGKCLPKQWVSTSPGGEISQQRAGEAGLTGRLREVIEVTIEVTHD
eukprot:GHVU01168743.1.p1 GENE.GHVU01168743.1~~GHVU01168743.1.p1  ORF type:complete len:187 (+),score=21.13 GHVU01168743.1:221-781(+)